MAFTVSLPAAVLVTTLRAVWPVVWRGAVLIITAAVRMPTVVLLAAVLVLVQLLPYHAGARGHAGVVQMATIMQCVHEQFYQHCQRLVVGWRGLFCRAVLACSIFVTFCDPPAAYRAAELGCAACGFQMDAIVQSVREQGSGHITRD